MNTSRSNFDVNLYQETQNTVVAGWEYGS